MRLVKGSHIIVPKFWSGANAYLVQNHDKRVIFINPYEGDKALIGTTDIAYEGRAEDVAADEKEIDYLITAVNRYFKEKLRREDVLHSFSGVRPLFDDGKGNPSAVTRDYVFDLDETGGAPLLNVFGGKITTFRELAERGMHRLKHYFPANGRRLDPRPRRCPAARLPMPIMKPSPIPYATPIHGCRAHSFIIMDGSMVRAQRMWWLARRTSKGLAVTSAAISMRRKCAIWWPENGQRRQKTFSIAAPSITCI